MIDLAISVLFFLIAYWVARTATTKLVFKEG